MRRGVLEEDVPHVSLLFSVKAFDIFSQRERERSGEWWWFFLGGPFGEA